MHVGGRIIVVDGSIEEVKAASLLALLALLSGVLIVVAVALLALRLGW